MTSKRENNHIRGFAMQQFVENDSSVVLLLDFQVQNDPQTKIQPFQFFCHVEISGKGPLICTSGSSGS